MKKKLISLLLTSAMSFSFCASAMAATNFTDANGDVITSIPDIGKVNVSNEDAGVVLIAEYSKDGRLLRVNVDSMEDINDFDENTYVKAFAWDNFTNINPITNYATIGKDSEKTLLVSYANGFTESTATNKPKILNSNPDYTYGSAGYSAQRTNVFEAGEELPENITLSSYNTVKIRYYAGNVETDRFWFCFMSSSSYGSYNSLTNRYLYASVIPERVGWNVATVKFADMSKNNTSDNANTDEDDTVALPVSEVTHYGIMTHEGKKLFGSNEATPSAYNTSLYIDSIWLEKTKPVDVIDFSDDSTWTKLGTMAQFTKDTTVGYDTKTQSAKVTGLTSNTTGYIDLEAIGFTTDWSEYKTINIRYKTSNTEYVPPVRLTTVQDWATSSSETDGAFKPIYGIYSSKKADNINEWTVVSYDLATEFKANNTKGNITWSNIPYLQIATWNLYEIWNKDSSVTYKEWNKTDEIYIDSIWLEK